MRKTLYPYLQCRKQSWLCHQVCCSCGNHQGKKYYQRGYPLGMLDAALSSSLEKALVLVKNTVKGLQFAAIYFRPGMGLLDCETEQTINWLDSSWRRGKETTSLKVESYKHQQWRTWISVHQIVWGENPCVRAQGGPRKSRSKGGYLRNSVE